jgi:hypothetical protein
MMYSLNSVAPAAGALLLLLSFPARPPLVPATLVGQQRSALACLALVCLVANRPMPSLPEEPLPAGRTDSKPFNLPASRLRTAI